MARTKASVGAKVSSGKSSKAVKVSAPPSVVPSGSSKSERSSKSIGGGNPVCPRETPVWQKPITNFFITRPREQNDDDSGATTSKTKSKRPTIESDSDTSPEKPKNSELDESITLEPLTGENSHKIGEYFPKNGEKGKGVGKKSRGKENFGSNGKRGRDENEHEENVNKKVKV